MLKLLKGEVYNEIFSDGKWSELTEIRVRLGQKVCYRLGVKRCYTDFVATGDYIKHIVNTASNFSLYSREDEVRRGYLSYRDGVRVGLSGEGVLNKNEVNTLKSITSLNIRIPHEIVGCAEMLGNVIDNFDSTIVVSPPFCGKTTLVRDMARLLSQDNDVLILDERGELAGTLSNNKFTFDVGKNFDVISNIPKSKAYEWGIRTMSPGIIIMDEIFPKNDTDTLGEIARSGIKMICTIHADSIDYLIKTEPFLMKLFKYAVLLTSNPTMGSIKSIKRLNLNG